MSSKFLHYFLIFSLRVYYSFFWTGVGSRKTPKSCIKSQAVGTVYKKDLGDLEIKSGPDK
jgi:hypothetical protein